MTFFAMVANGRSCRMFLRLACTAWMLIVPPCASGQEIAEVQERTLAAVSQVCRSGMDAPPLADAKLQSEVRFDDRDVGHWRRVWVTGTEQIQVTQAAKNGYPVLYFVAYLGGPSKQRPFLRIVTGERCEIRGGEAIEYEATSGKAVWLHLLGPNLKARSRPIPINPPVPTLPVENQECIRVAILDNGVNYLLPAIASRLAREEDGTLVGYDFWEGDERPFDFGVPESEPDPKMSPFDPPRHGTSVASVFLIAAPVFVCLAAYRYHPGDFGNQIGEMIDRIAADGARIIVTATGRSRPWPEFRSAMERHRELLFVAAAGNEGADLAKNPIFPMAYAEPNLLVVAATEADGSLWDRSNRGKGLVHIAVPADGIPGWRFDGSPAQLTGTSFAAPRIGALAGVLLRRRPDLSGADLRDEVLRIAGAESAVTNDPVLLDEVQFQTLLKREISGAGE